MSGKSGKEFLLKMSDGAGSPAFAVIGGTRQIQASGDAEVIDITSQDSSGEWKEILDAHGLKSFKLTASGVCILSDAQEAAVRTVFFAGTIRAWQIIDVTQSVTHTQNFKVVSFEKSGDYKGEQTWSISLQSSGAPVIS